LSLVDCPFSLAIIGPAADPPFRYSAAKITPQTGRQGAVYRSSQGATNRVRPLRPSGTPSHYYCWHQNDGARIILPFDITGLRPAPRYQAGCVSLRQRKPRHMGGASHVPARRCVYTRRVHLVASQKRKMGDGQVNGRTLWHIGVAMTIAFVHCNSAYAACLAYALPLNTMFTTENSAYIPFQVTVTNCRDGCSGWVEYDFQYINGFNVIMSYSSTFQWESDAGEPVTVTEEIPLTSCTEYYGGCREVHVIRHLAKAATLVLLTELLPT